MNIIKEDLYLHTGSKHSVLVFASTLCGGFLLVSGSQKISIHGGHPKEEGFLFKCFI